MALCRTEEGGLVERLGGGGLFELRCLVWTCWQAFESWCVLVHGHMPVYTRALGFVHLMLFGGRHEAFASLRCTLGLLLLVMRKCCWNFRTCGSSGVHLVQLISLRVAIIPLKERSFLQIFDFFSIEHLAIFLRMHLCLRVKMLFTFWRRLLTSILLFERLVELPRSCQLLIQSSKVNAFASIMVCVELFLVHFSNEFKYFGFLIYSNILI